MSEGDSNVLICGYTQEDWSKLGYSKQLEAAWHFDSKIRDKRRMSVERRGQVVKTQKRILQPRKR